MRVWPRRRWRSPSLGEWARAISKVARAVLIIEELLWASIGLSHRVVQFWVGKLELHGRTFVVGI